ATRRLLPLGPGVAPARRSGRGAPAHRRRDGAGPGAGEPGPLERLVHDARAVVGAASLVAVALPMAVTATARPGAVGERLDRHLDLQGAALALGILEGEGRRDGAALLKRLGELHQHQVMAA